MVSEKIVSYDACSGKAVATLGDFEVDPSITVQPCELVFANELVWDVQDFDVNVLWLEHGRV